MIEATHLADKPSYTDLERKIKKLERQALDSKLKEKRFYEERKRIEIRHWERTTSLVRIYEELNRKTTKKSMLKLKISKKN